MLTDHNPMKKTVNLSESVYSERNAAAAAVAAHECTTQYNTPKGEWLKMRSVLVPMVSVASNLSMWVIIAGLGLFITQSYTIASIGVAMFGLGTFLVLSPFLSNTMRVTELWPG